MDDPKNKQRWQITLEDAGDLVPGIARLRRFLKCAWRAYGLKCVGIAEECPAKRTELPAGASVKEK